MLLLSRLPPEQCFDAESVQCSLRDFNAAFGTAMDPRDFVCVALSVVSLFPPDPAVSEFTIRTGPNAHHASASTTTPLPAQCQPPAAREIGIVVPIPYLQHPVRSGPSAWGRAGQGYLRRSLVYIYQEAHPSLPRWCLSHRLRLEGLARARVFIRGQVEQNSM